MSSTGVRLELPSETLFASYREGYAETVGHVPEPYILPDPSVGVTALLAQFADERAGRNLPPGFIPSTTFWLTDGTSWLGAGNLRHGLSPTLRVWGGQIGYAIRTSARGRGLGRFAARALLAEARKLGYAEVLATAETANAASCAILAGLPATRREEAQEMVRGILRPILRFWIDCRMART